MNNVLSEKEDDIVAQPSIQGAQSPPYDVLKIWRKKNSKLQYNDYPAISFTPKIFDIVLLR